MVGFWIGYQYHKYEIDYPVFQPIITKIDPILGNPTIWIGIWSQISKWLESST